MQFARTQERRKSRRIRIGQPVKIRPSDPRDGHFEDSTTTKNVSKDGIYFLTQISQYAEGMRLFVVAPHHTPKDPHDREYLAQVVRVDALPEKQWGVAVQLLSDWQAK